MSDPVASRVSRGAVASLVLGLASLLLLFLAGIPAIWVGVNALRAMNAGEGWPRGRRLALAGIALGGVGCAVAVAGLLVIVYTTLQARSQRLACENNLRRIGAAVLNYQTTNNVFPPGALPNGALPPERRLSWLAALPPFLEQKAKDSPRMQALYGQLDLSEAWDSGPNAAVATSTAPLCRCPAHAFEDPHVAAGNTDYVGLAGVGRDAAELPITDPNAGVLGYDRTVRLDDLKAGARATLLAAETGRDNGPWTAGGRATVRGIDPADVPHVGPGRAFGGLHHGGLNVLFADGSAEFLGEGVSPQFLETLTRLRRDEAAPAAP